MTRGRLVVVATCALWMACPVTTRALGDGAATPETPHQRQLLLKDVLDSVDAHHPLVEAELHALRGARGAQLSARGAYDPTLKVEAEAAPWGYYDYQRADASVRQLTPWFGSELYAGYRVQEGNLPDYFGELQTLDRGEVRVGIRIPLWKDRSIDDARAARTRSVADVDAAESRVDGVKLQLWLDAAVAYYDWVAAVESRRVHAELLELAELRVVQVARKVSSGALAPFAQLDNQRALLSRQANLVMATRKLEQARLKLSMFWRGRGGEPMLAVQHRPPSLAVPSVDGQLGGERARARAVERHPELQRFRALERQALVSVELADNRVAPRLDLAGEVSRDVGGGDPDQVTALQPTVAKAAVVFEVPLGLRAARGKRDTARAKLAEVRAKVQFARDRVRMQVEDAASAVRRALQRAQQAREAARVAAELAQGERKRFEVGATTLVWVTMREKTAADAQLDAIRALVDAQLAWAAYRIALVERPTA